MAENQNLRVNIIGDSSKLNQALGKAEGRLKSFGKSLNTMGKSLTTRFTLPIVAAGGIAVKQAANFERLRTTLNTLTGSADAGAAAFERLVKFSAKTPFQLDELVKVNNTLMGFGLNADEAFQSLSMLGDIAGIVGGDLQSIGIAFGQAAAEGRVMTRDLRQFINNGVPILDILAESMGVARGEIMDMASEGKITFDVLNRAFIDSTSEGGKFEGGMNTLSKTLNGLFSTLKDNVNIALAELGQEIAEVLNLQEGIPALSKKIGELVQNFKNLDTQTKEIILKITSLSAALGPLAIFLGAVITGFEKIGVFFKNIIKFLAGRGGLVALVTGLGLAFKKMFDAAQTMSTSQMGRYGEMLYGPKVQDDIKKTTDNLKNLQTTLNGLTAAPLQGQGPLLPGQQRDVLSFLVKPINEGLKEISNNTREPIASLHELSSITTQGMADMEGAIIKGGEVLKGFGGELKRFVSIGEAFLPLIGQQLTAAFENLANGENTLKKLETALKGLIIRLTAAAAAAAVLSFFMGGPGGKAGTFKGFKGLFNMLGGPNLNAMVGTGNLGVFTGMASGGLAFGQTPVMVGDYSGVRSNPEVIAPLNKLKTLIDGGGSQNLSGEFVVRGQDLVLALQRAERNRNRFK